MIFNSHTPSCFGDAIKEFQEYFYSEALETFAPNIPKARKNLKRTLEQLADNIEKIIK